jgi:asparagine synthase (glutamine-hydrolysing)
LSGFFGTVRFDGMPVEDRLLENIAEAIAFRGPHGRSVWTQNNVGGAFTLIRTGPAKQESEQPVVWLDRYYLWGDIRLDGWLDLISHLGEEVATLSGATSETLLLRAWERWGPTCLERVIGEFSFALWDAKEKILWCARDFAGVRPFYYSRVQKAFFFSNTLQTLRLAPEISTELDEAFLGDFLLDGWNADASRTVYRDIKRLKAGHLLKLSKDNLEVRRFRKLPIEEPLRFKDPEEYRQAFRELLQICVKDRLPDGPAALYLSGGLDSGSVCAMASQIAQARGQKEQLKAFTVSWKAFFDDPEPDLAKLTAQHIGIAFETLQEETLNPFETTEGGDGISPEPGQNFFFAREQRNLRTIARHANVVLSGDGGDDVLIGQAWPYLVHLLQNREWKDFARDFGGYFWTHKAIPPMRGGFRTKFRKLVNREDQYAEYPAWLNPEFERRANLRERWLELGITRKNTEHPLHPEAYWSLHNNFWAAVLEAEDPGWTQVNLETRAALLDLRFLRFLLRLPPVPWCVKKELCRQAMKDLLPQTILERPKTPLLKHPIEAVNGDVEWLRGLPQISPGRIESFVNWTKWCETFYQSKGSLRWTILRPASLFHWLKAVENR